MQHYRPDWLVADALADALVLVLVLAACDRPTPSPGATQSAVLVAPAGANVVTIVARDFAWQIPDTIPAGLTTFRLRNDGNAPHDAALVRLDGGKTGADVVAFYTKPGPDAAWMHWVGGPAAAFPGAGQPTVTVMLAPGHYAVLCGVPGPDGRPHWMSGMVKDFTVSPSTSTAVAPSSDVAITLVDFDFHISTPITASTHTVRVTNSGTQDHHMVIVRLAPGKSLADVLAWAEKAQGPPPLVWGSGTASMSPGNVSYMHADFPPGQYALICFISDVHDGKPHFVHGMQKQFAVQ